LCWQAHSYIAPHRILHVNATAYLTLAWTLQQLRDAVPSDLTYRFLIHDRNSIYAQSLDQHMRHLGLRILNTLPQNPLANALCEQLIGTLRR
jgi:putative transposase